MRTVASGGGVLATLRGTADPGLNATLDFPNSASALDLNESATLLDADLALTNVPANMTVNATGPSGAVVTYTPPTATDEGGETPTVGCLPASGSLFAIGTSTVTCTATDSDDSNSPVTAQFSVTVRGALAQLGDLLANVNALGSSVPKANLAKLMVELQDAISASNTNIRACPDLSNSVLIAQLEQAAGALTPGQAATIISAANQIAAVIGCRGAVPAAAAPQAAVKHSGHTRHHGSKTRSKR